MKYRHLAVICIVIIAVQACGLPGAASTPTAAPMPPTPNFLPLPVPAVTSAPATSPTTAPATASFTGTWVGVDADDGSTMTLTLVQSGSSLTGTYADSFSGSIAPPGFQGPVSGSVSSATTGQISLNVQRHDGESLNLQASLALSAAQDVLTVTIASGNADPWIFRRQ